VVTTGFWYHNLHFSPKGHRKASFTNLRAFLGRLVCLLSTAHIHHRRYTATQYIYAFPASLFLQLCISSRFFIVSSIASVVATPFLGFWIADERTEPKWHNLTPWNRQAPTTKKHSPSSTNAVTSVLRSRAWAIC